jgi:hypothetical protein
MTRFKINTSGMEILVPTGVDLTTATVLTLHFEKGDNGTVVSKVAADGVTDNAAPTEGKLYYKIEDELLDTAGKWKVVPAMTFGSDTMEGDPASYFEVVERFQE